LDSLATAAARLVHALDERVHILGGGHAQLVHGLGGALLEDGFELVPVLAGLGRHGAGHRRHLAGDFVDLVFSQALGLLLQGHAFLDQGLEDLGAFFLRLLEGAHAGQPDLLRGLLDGCGQLAVHQAGSLGAGGWTWRRCSSSS
jgi:hypothetical protein